MSVITCIITNILFISVYSIHSKHDAWSKIVEFIDRNTTQQLRLVSTAQKAFVDKRFIDLSQLIDTLSEDNYNQTVHQIKDLIDQNMALKLPLRAKPHLFTKLLFPQIMNGKIITDNLRINQNISRSKSFIEHFYDQLTLIKQPYKDESVTIYGRLFALKMIDNGYHRELHSIRSANILGFIRKSRNLGRALAFDNGVFDIIYNPLFYPSTCTHNFVEVMIRTFKKYWYFKGVHQWLDAKVPHILVLRRSYSHIWKSTVIDHMEHLWKTHKPLFGSNEYIQNIEGLGGLLSWLRKDLGFSDTDAMDQFGFQLFGTLLQLNYTYTPS